MLLQPKLQVSIKKFNGNRNDGFNIKDEYSKIMNGEEDYLKTLFKDGANIRNILAYKKSKKHIPKILNMKN